MPVSLATQKAEIRKIELFEDSLGKQFLRPYQKKPTTKKSCGNDSRCRL
jgi:hypothetical protein